MNNRKVWTGVLAGVLAAGLLVSVAFGAFRAGQRHDVVTRVAGDGQIVRVIDNDAHWGGHWGYGPGPGFFLFPLLGIGLVVLLVGRGRRGHYGFGGPGYGPGGGCGPRPSIDDWHRRAHEESSAGESAAPAPPTS
ncbi:MAG: hypothetical protein QOG43_1827 [Actinomycetota bacterium]|jgi:hypothetical protein|nr:hypothetical protein [Actinomycetota bacterium]